MGREKQQKHEDRRDKAEKIKDNIISTLHNMEAAEEMIANSPDNKARRDLEEKNVRRAQALPSMVREMKEEEAKKELGLDE